jgi:predicted membrane protein
MAAKEEKQQKENVLIEKLGKKAFLEMRIGKVKKQKIALLLLAAAVFTVSIIIYLVTGKNIANSIFIISLILLAFTMMVCLYSFNNFIFLQKQYEQDLKKVLNKEKTENISK